MSLKLLIGCRTFGRIVSDVKSCSKVQNTNLVVVINIRDAETQFEIDEFNDLFAKTKPTLYIKLADVFAIHNLVIDDLPSLCPSQDDPLREIIRELGSAKNNENELLHVSSTEITLTLNPKYHEQEGKLASSNMLSLVD